MTKSISAWLALIAGVIVLAGCAGGSTQQMQMSGSDRDYPGPGAFTGEDGKGLVYSSDWKIVKEEDMSAEDRAATADMNDEEKQKYFEWKAEKDKQEFEAWQKAQQDQEAP